MSIECFDVIDMIKITKFIKKKINRTVSYNGKQKRILYSNKHLVHRERLAAVLNIQIV